MLEVSEEIKAEIEYLPVTAITFPSIEAMIAGSTV
jgi:hypothetical protein